MKKAISLLGIGVFVALTGCGSSENTGKDTEAAKPATPPVTGAIWTTTEDGSIVNENHYDDCRMVYLNGGPKGGGKGPQDGDYYFMVTDPSGKDLLSSDSITQRKVTIKGGQFFSYSGSHDTGIDIDSGALTVQLWPFDETTNPGGVYKAWLTPVAAYDTNAKNNVHGFLHSRSKTDNFKCERAKPPKPDAGPPPNDSGPPPCEGEECIE